MAVTKAPVSSVKGRMKLGGANTRASVKVHFNWSKAT